MKLFSQVFPLKTKKRRKKKKSLPDVHGARVLYLNYADSITLLVFFAVLLFFLFSPPPPPPSPRPHPVNMFVS